MSIQNSKFFSNQIEPTVLIPLKYVSDVRWTQEMGHNLKSLRGKTSRRELSEKLKTIGYSCSHQNIQRIEDGVAKTVPYELIVSISQALDIEISKIVPVIALSQEGL